MASTSSSSTVTIDELKRVLESLKTQRETINSVYNDKIQSVINNSASCFGIAGLDCTKIEESYRDTFATINTNFEKLIDILENDVIKNYSELSLAIKQMFNIDFANQMETLLNLK